MVSRVLESHNQLLQENTELRMRLGASQIAEHKLREDLQDTQGRLEILQQDIRGLEGLIGIDEDLSLTRSRSADTGALILQTQGSVRPLCATGPGSNSSPNVLQVAREMQERKLRRPRSASWHDFPRSPRSTQAIDAVAPHSAFLPGGSPPALPAYSTTSLTQPFAGVRERSSSQNNPTSPRSLIPSPMQRTSHFIPSRRERSTSSLSTIRRRSPVAGLPPTGPVQASGERESKQRPSTGSLELEHAARTAAQLASQRGSKNNI